MSKEQDIAKAQRADKLLKDEDLQGAFDSVRQALFEKIEQTPMRDDEGLKQLRIMLKLLKDVRANLERAIRDGKLASEELRIERERGKVRLFR